MDQGQDTIRKIKDKTIRTDMMDQMIAFKQQVATIYGIMAKDSSNKLDNLLIAQLNDAAYKAVRKTGVQKKLDERAMKNEEQYKKLNLQLEAAFNKIDFDKVTAAHDEIMNEKIGQCPMSQCSVVELMKQKDCMCLGLAIKRSNATISDPTKLIIADVFPVYMGLDSFLESAIYNLKMNQDAAGNFDIKDEGGQLAVGAGRESLTGLMPLYLFEEHWEIAKRKVQPLYGFMCTLEALGYTASQFFVIPFLVLLKANAQRIDSPSSANE